ncbi:MAG: response regulator [Gammaproteobacteria bacterium]
MHVLLVDDYALYRDSLVAALRACAPGLTVTVHATAAQAWAALAADAERYDLVLVDDELGAGPRGLDWAVRIRARHPSLPCALLVAEVEGARCDEARRAGLAACLAKALDIPEFLAAFAAVQRGQTWYADVDRGRGEARARRRGERD